MSNLKVNPDKLREALQLLADSSSPNHPGVLQGAMDAAFEEDAGGSSSDAPAADAKPQDPVSPASETPLDAPAAETAAPAEPPPSDPAAREGWLQRELDKLRGKQ